MVIVDLLAMFVFGISGGLTAVRMRLDIVGVAVLGTVTGLGGGWLRDVLIGDVPPPGLSDWRYLTAALLGGLITFFLHPAINRLQPLINVFDAIGLGLFSVAGALKATEYGLGPMPATILGLVTGVGGGVIRDVLAGEVPTVLRRRDLYAIPALAGAGLAVVGTRLDLPTVLVVVVAAGVTIVWRLLASWRGWTAPEPFHAARSE
ncbi:trimeric intracellular cation channel family protein [Nocardioides cavernaquae]|uniref:Trimeric intracellular cation channel family protein n=1 Tax=Nocardioides cavernaquae TaxID=2321396 RepID=A0A3A5H8P0_9ACTN|nr:TRIC cation channel family protein [Nocardioides cavernaquae]RJS45745.1 trimeric intracellular cation channel family protein [Nocardioides cavernaquae]